MAFDWKSIKKAAERVLDDVSTQLDSAVTTTSKYVQKEITPEVTKLGANMSEKAKSLAMEAKYAVQNAKQNIDKRLSNWSEEGKANNIPCKYTDTVKTALVAAAAVGPLGVVGVATDSLAIAGIWTTMFLAIRSKSNNPFGKDPKRIAGGVASGIVKYYIGCKVATYACFLIPGAGIFAGMSVSSVCNIYFTYNFASILIQLMDTKSSYSDDDIINEIISLIKKMPSVEEIKEIVYIYQKE